MIESHGSTPLNPGVERLLSSLTGVYSAHVVAGPEGTLREIHVLATPDLHPKQIVRNVESALSAGLGIQIDRRIVSVAQLRPDAVDTVSGAAVVDVEAPTPTQEAVSEPDIVAERRAYPSAPPTATPAVGTRVDERMRVVYLGYDARIDAEQRATCRVTLRAGAEEFTGEGQGPNTLRGRAEAAARAVFAALAMCRAEDRLGFEGAAIVDSHGRSYALISARALSERRPIPLTGAALLDRSPEEAAILASLQATNRWRAVL